MGFLSRIFPNTSDEPDIAATASNADSVTAPAPVPAQPDNDYVQMPEELRAFIKETRGFDPMPNPVHISTFLTPEQYAQHMEKRRSAAEALKNQPPSQPPDISESSPTPDRFSRARLEKRYPYPAP